MQINRLNHLVFPPSTPQTSANPIPAPAPEVEKTAPVAAPTPGVIYTGAGKSALPAATDSTDTADISKLPLDGLLELGKSKGVFTKITYSKEGVLAGAAQAAQTSKPDAFVSSAVATMRDFEEGIAALKGQAAAPEASKVGAFLSSGLRDIKQAASKLNVFA